jgi:hypothetical protein
VRAAEDAGGSEGREGVLGGEKGCGGRLEHVRIFPSRVEQARSQKERRWVRLTTFDGETAKSELADSESAT